MHRSNRHGLRRSLALALPIALLGATPAVAGEDDRMASAEEIARVRAALEAKGYTEVHDVEVDDGRYEADALNPAGQRVDLELDLESLEILDEDPD
jgi:hypothetical protein